MEHPQNGVGKLGLITTVSKPCPKLAQHLEKLAQNNFWKYKENIIKTKLNFLLIFGPIL